MSEDLTRLGPDNFEQLLLAWLYTSWAPELRHRSENRAADTHRGSDAAFLDRFLAGRGAGPHHFNFLVTDIEDALTLIKASGIDPHRGQPGQSGLEGGLPAPAQQPWHRHPGRSAPQRHRPVAHPAWYPSLCG